MVKQDPLELINGAVFETLFSLLCAEKKRFCPGGVTEKEKAHEVSSLLNVDGILE